MKPIKPPAQVKPEKAYAALGCMTGEIKYFITLTYLNNFLDEEGEDYPYWRRYEEGDID